MSKLKNTKAAKQRRIDRLEARLSAKKHKPAQKWNKTKREWVRY